MENQTQEKNPKTWAYDIESFPNYFLVSFYDGTIHKDFEYFNEESSDTSKLESFLKNEVCTLFSFNGRAYDNLVLAQFFKTKSITDTKNYSDKFFKGKRQHNPFTKTLTDGLASIFSTNIRDIDLKSLLNIQASLKVVECALGMESIEESPIAFDAVLNLADLEQIKKYCHHDTKATWLLSQHKQTKEAIAVRESVTQEFKPSQDVFSYSEPTIVSTVLPALAKRMQCLPEKHPFRDNKTFSGDCYGVELIDSNIIFSTQDLQALLEDAKSHLYIAKGDIKKLEKRIDLFGCKFNFALGGLHTINTPLAVQGNEDYTIFDVDVASYYPSLILKYGVAPERWKEPFLKVYESIVENRLQAKKEGKKGKANAYKLILNSTFGKLKSESSVLHNKKGQLVVTLNGQLLLFKLLESVMLSTSCKLLQANTDGITVYVKRSETDRLRKICKDWELETGFSLEEKEYKTLVMSNVNSYIATDCKDEIKAKGVYSITDNFKSGRKIPNIVKRALVDSALQNKTVQEVITANRNALDYIVYGKRPTLFFNGKELNQKVYRGYYTVDGGNLEGSTTKGKTTVEHGFTLLNNLSDFDFAKIDVARYHELIEQYRKSGGTDETDNETDEIEIEIEETEATETEKQDRLRTFRMFPDCDYIVSKHGTDTACNLSIESNNQYNLKLYIPKGLCVIDIDNVEKSREKFSGCLDKLQSSLVCAYSTDDIQEVLACKKRGHIYFRLAENDQFSGKRVILQDGKTITELMADGIAMRVPSTLHPQKQQEYKWLGTAQTIQDIPELPHEILELFPVKENKQSNHKHRQFDVSLVEFSQMVGIPLAYGKDILCPFCKGGTDGKPTMYVHPQNNFHCYRESCKKTVGFDGFLAQIKNLSLEDARNILTSQESSLEVPKINVTVENRENLLNVLKGQISTLREKSWMLFTGGTGLGKTCAVAKYCLETSEKVIVFFSTTKEMTRFKGMLLNDNPAVEITEFSARSGDKEDLEEIQEKETGKRIILAQSEYLFQKAQSTEGYKRLQKHLENRLCFIDEAHVFFKHLLEFIPLFGAYTGYSKTLFHTAKCPKSSKMLGKDSECNCKFSCNRLDARRKNLPFYELSNHLVPGEITNTSPYPKDWLDFSTYIHVEGTTLGYKFVDDVTFLPCDNIPSEFVDYLKFTLSNLANPHLRVELPVPGKDGKLVYPKNACKCPSLCGLNRFALQQLNLAKNAIFITATSNQELENSFRGFKKADFSKCELSTQTKTVFPVAMLKTCDVFGMDRLVKIMQKLEEKAFIVSAYASDAENLYKLADKFVTGKTIKIFKDRGYHQTQASNVDDETSHFLLSHARSSICTGVDLTDKSIAIVDCGQYVPLAAVGTISKNSTRESIQNEILGEIRLQVTQILGRLLRGDVRQIVAVLHNLPTTLLELDLDKDVANTRHHYNFVSTLKGRALDSILGNIESAFAGKDVKDYSIEDAKATVGIADKKLSKRQRLNPERKKAIEENSTTGKEKRLEEIREKIVGMKNEGKSWTQTSNALNLRRCLDKKEAVKLKKLFKSL